MEGKEVIIKKVKKAGHAGGHGGSWKVAYADFVTAMMAFFLLMWLVTAMKQRQDLKAGIAEYFKEYNLLKGEKEIKTKIQAVIKVINEGTGTRPPTEEDKVRLLEAEKNKGEQILKALKSEIEFRLADVMNQILIDTYEGAIRIQIVDLEKGEPIFSASSAQMAPVGRRILEVISAQLRGNDSRVAIEGHTDSATQAPQGNWELSLLRAAEARRVLVSYGFNPLNVIRLSGYADTQPIVKSNPFDPRNRRVSLLIYQPPQ